MEAEVGTDRQLPKTLRLLSYVVGGLKLLVAVAILSLLIYTSVTIDDSEERVVVFLVTLYLTPLLVLVLIGQLWATRSDNAARLLKFALVVLLFDIAVFGVGVGEINSGFAVAVVVNLVLQVAIAFGAAGITTYSGRRPR